MATSTTARQARGGEVRHALFAALYDRLTAPLERDVLGPRRTALLGELEGQVLDVGAGTGANLPHVHRAGRLVATEPDRAMRRRLARKLADARVPVELAGAAAESLPFPDATFDAVVFACVLCTVTDPDAANRGGGPRAEARRPADRARACPRDRPAGALAGPRHAAVVAADGRMPPEPRHRGDDRARRVHVRADRALRPLPALGSHQADARGRRLAPDRGRRESR